MSTTFAVGACGGACGVEQLLQIQRKGQFAQVSVEGLRSLRFDATKNDVAFLIRQVICEGKGLIDNLVVCETGLLSTDGILFFLWWALQYETSFGIG